MDIFGIPDTLENLNRSETMDKTVKNAQNIANNPLKECCTFDPVFVGSGHIGPTSSKNLLKSIFYTGKKI